MARLGMGIGLVLCLLTVAGMAATTGAAQVTGVKGTVVLTRAGKAQPCSIFIGLQAGDHVQVSADSQVTLFFYGDSHREVIPGAVSFAVTAAGTDVPAAHKTVSQAPGALKVAGGSLQGLNSDQFGGSVKRGGVGQAAPVTLLNGPNVLASQPTLRWDAVDGAATYTVAVQKDFGEPVFIQETVSTSSYKLAQPLERGKTCVVKVVAHGSDGRALTEGSALLQVLGDAEAQQLEALHSEADAQVAKNPDDLSPYLTLAARYVHEGLTAEAVEVFQLLADKAPSSSYPHLRMAALYTRAGLVQAAASEKTKAASL